MKKKRGFTLVELLAVIAILAILVIIALPNIMTMFNNAKKNSFETEIKEIFKTAEQKWVSDSLTNTSERVYARKSDNSCVTALDLTGRTELEYLIRINKAGKVIEYYATDGTYQYSYDGNGLKVEDIKDVEQIASTLDTGNVDITCQVATRIPSTPIEEDDYLMNLSMTQEATSYFLRTNIKREDIEKLTFTNSIGGYTANGVNCWDVSKGQTGKVLAWAVDSDDDGLFEITIGSDSGVAIKQGYYLFSYMSNLKSIDGMKYLITNYLISTDSMFAYDNSLSSIDLRYFKTSEVTNMQHMFTWCSSLTSLNLSGFDTSKVTNMAFMFENTTNLQSLDLSSWTTSSLTDMRAMFLGSGVSSINLSGWDTTNVANMSKTFEKCRNLTSLDLSSFDTSSLRWMDGMFKDCTHLTTIYASNKFDTTSTPQSQTNEAFLNATRLVGGNGTIYDSSHLDKSYAHIDTAGNPGYFTAK